MSRLLITILALALLTLGWILADLTSPLVTLVLHGQPLASEMRGGPICAPPCRFSGCQRGLA